MFPPQAIDKRNQNIIRSILESPPPANVSHAEEKVREGGGGMFTVLSGEDVLPVVCPGKGDDCSRRSAQLASSSRIRRRMGTLWQSERKHAALGEDVSPSKSARFVTQSAPLSFLPGVSALFTWGVIAENGTTHIAVVPGGWTEDQLEDPNTYLKVF